MRGDVQVVDDLNRALKHELAAVNQYWLHYRIFDNLGYKDFAKTWRKESIEEMQHADQLVAGRAIERSLGYASPQVQSALPLKRDGPRARQVHPNKSKLIQINPRKIAWISLDSFGGIGAFQ
jgi:hypothetical protein